MVRASPADRPVPLPRPPTSFVGREQELARLSALLGRDEVRLVTLTGPGGVGKTRLALRLAEMRRDSFAERVAFVDLVPLADPAHVAPTVAQALGVRNAGERPLVEQLVDELRERPPLLILDNFEQVVDAARFVSQLLAGAPSLTVLVTSREPLRLAAEHVVSVPPLELPESARPVDEVASAEAVRLFVERAEAARADFALSAENAAAVAEICRRLDGLPLAIELAATRVTHLPPAALAARLEHRLPLLTGGARDMPQRHRTMRDAVAWSFDLLALAEQSIFGRLSVFVGSFGLEAAEAVGGGLGDPGAEVLDGLASLVTKGLLRAEAGPDGEPRYRMLGTVREFALEQLVRSGAEEAAREAHAAHFVELVEQIEPELVGPDQVAALALLDSDQANIRTALAWLTETRRAEAALRLAGPLHMYWYIRSRYAEGRAALAAALALPDAAAPTAARAKALAGAAWLAGWQRDHDVAAERGREAVALARAVEAPPALALALAALAWMASERGEHNRAEELGLEALGIYHAMGSALDAAEVLNLLGDAAAARGDVDAAVARIEEGIALARPLGDTRGLAALVGDLAFLMLTRCEFRRAMDLFAESLTQSQRVGDPFMVGWCLAGVAGVAAVNDLPERAVWLFGASDALRESCGAPSPLCERDIYARLLAQARAVLGEDKFAEAVAAGRLLPMDTAIAEANTTIRLIREAEPAAARSPASGKLQNELTPREAEVLRLLVAGKSNAEIGAALFISPRTASTHVTAILAKLGVATRAEAAAAAVREGLI
jgi:predicted ATPase/DNA-binding CsgD family transcriptional regulator